MTERATHPKETVSEKDKENLANKLIQRFPIGGKIEDGFKGPKLNYRLLVPLTNEGIRINGDKGNVRHVVKGVTFVEESKDDAPYVYLVTYPKPENIGTIAVNSSGVAEPSQKVWAKNYYKVVQQTSGQSDVFVAYTQPDEDDKDAWLQPTVSEIARLYVDLEQAVDISEPLLPADPGK